MATGQNLITIRKATHTDIPSLTTIVPRSFYSSNAFIKKCFPDTPRMRDYWAEVFKAEITSDVSNVLIAFDSATDTVAGFLCLRLLGSDDRGSGIFTEHPFCEDTPVDTLQPAIDCSTEYRERLFLGKGQQHYIIQVFGVDEAYQKLGLGRLLLQHAVDMADDRGVPAFVEANGGAKAFYAKFGFMEEGTAVMPGPIKHEECIMVRPRKSG